MANTASQRLEEKLASVTKQVGTNFSLYILSTYHDGISCLAKDLCWWQRGQSATPPSNQPALRDRKDYPVESQAQSSCFGILTTVRFLQCCMKVDSFDGYLGSL